jgi:negative regulator of sigma E activity
MSTPRTLLQLGLLASFCSSLVAQSTMITGVPTQPAVATIVERMEAAQSGVQNQSSYSLKRQYRLYHEKQDIASSETIAAVNSSPSGKEYEIERHSGNSRAEQVVRRILDHEVQDSIQPAEARADAITRSNYDFDLVSEALLDGRSCYLLRISPKRKDKNLLVGNVWVDKSSFLVRRVEGNMIKTPSWWLKSVHVSVSFESVQGTWVQKNMQAVADARLVGVQILKAENLEVRNAGMLAANGVPPMRAANNKHSITHHIPAELLLQPLNRK